MLILFKYLGLGNQISNYIVITDVIPTTVVLAQIS